VTKKQLNPLQLTARSAAELSARASQIVGWDAGGADFPGVSPEHLPDDLFAQAFAGLRSSLYGSEPTEASLRVVVPNASIASVFRISFPW
jgi:hypothetical protein